MLHTPLSPLALAGLRKKVKGKLEKMLLSNFPIRQEFKPRGIKDLKSLQESGSIELKVLREPYVSTLGQHEIYSLCSDYIKPVMASQNPGDFLAIIKDGRIMQDTGSNMAVVSSDGYLIKELSFQWNRGLVGVEHNAFLKQKGFTSPKKINGTVFSMLAGGGAITYYYHWIVDSLPKLFLLKEAGLFDQIDYFMVPNYSADYHRDTLEYFGIRQNRIISSRTEHHIQADSLIVSSYTRVDGHHPEWVCKGLHDTFVGPKPSSSNDKLIYISRADAKQRRVLNEPELIAMLQKYGFEVHTMSSLSMARKAELLNSARLVVGPHGSGSVNFVLCKPGTKILDLLPDNCVVPFICDVCLKSGLTYEYLLCESDGNATNAVEGQKINLSVNVAQVEEKVQALLSETHA